MNPPIYDWCKADTTLAALLDGGSGLRIYEDELRQGTAYPAVRWFLVTGDPANYMDGPPGIDNGRFQFDVFAPNVSQRRSVSLALRTVLEQHGYVISYNGTGRDELTKQYFSSFDVSLWQER